MLRYFMNIVILLSFLLQINIISAIQENSSEDPDIAKTLVDHLFKNRDGFKIDSKDEQSVVAGGGSPVFGEITFEGAKKLLERLKLNKNSVVFDLGCGIGKFVIQAYLATDSKKVVGIELSVERCKHCQEACTELKKLPFDKSRKLEFYQQNILDADLSDATVVYMCSTCYPEKLMKDITDKIAKLKPGLLVATLKKLPQHEDFELIDTMNLPMTWSSNIPVFIYTLKRKRSRVPGLSPKTKKQNDIESEEKYDF